MELYKTMDIIFNLSMSLLSAGLQEKIKGLFTSNTIKKNEFFTEVFKQSIKDTCTYFKNNHNDEIQNNSKLIELLLALDDDIKLKIIFEDDRIKKIWLYPELNYFDKLKKVLKRYVSINFSEEIEDRFYDLWIDKFKEIYKQNLEEKILQNDVAYKKYMLVTQTHLLENTSKINPDDITEIKETVTNLSAQINSNKNGLILTNNTTNPNNKIDNQIQKFIDNKDYTNCLDYIKKKIELNDKQKSELLNQKGYCEFKLQDYHLAAQSYEEAYNLDKTNDKNISDIIKCLINTNQFNKIKNYINKYNDKNSALYYESKFYELLYADNDIENAEKLLEKHKNKISNYNLYKAELLIKTKASYGECIKYMSLYLQEHPENKTVKYELFKILYSEIFDKNRIQFLIGVKKDDTIEILPTFNKQINAQKVNILINEIEFALNNEQEIPVEYLLSLKIMLSILYIQQNNLSKVEKYIPIIPQNNNILNDVFDINNFCLLLLIQKHYKKAYELYEKYLALDNQDINLNLILNFVLKKFKVCLDLIDKYNLPNSDLISVHSRYKIKSWKENKKYFENHFEEYNTSIKMLILDYFYENKEYTFCTQKYIEIAEKIINNKIIVSKEIVLVIAHNLKSQNNSSLADKLIEFYWNKNPNKENFDIGLSYSKQLYNKKMYAKCFEILNTLSQIDCKNTEVQELYILLDLASGAYHSVINAYEKGLISNNFLPHVAIAYINSKKFDKAEEILEKFKNVDELRENYYTIKNVLYFKTSEYNKLINNIIEAQKVFPDNIKIDKQIITFGLNIPKDVVIQNQFFILQQRAMKNLIDKNIIQQIKVNEDNLEELRNFILEQNKLNNINTRKELFKGIYEKYNKFQYPIEFLYEAIGNQNRIEVFANLLQSKIERVNINLGNSNFTKKETEYLENNERVLIGIDSLILLNELGLDLKARGTLNLHISNYTKQEIEMFLFEENSKSEKKGILGTNDAGELCYTEKSKEYQKYLPFLTQVSETYPQLERNSTSRMGGKLIEIAENFDTNTLFQDVIIAEQNSNTVACIDGVMNAVFHNEGARVVSTLSIIEYLMIKKQISYTQYYMAKLQLIKLNCHNIPLTANDLIFAIENRTYEEFVLLIKTLQDKNYTIDSIAIVLAELIVLLENNDNISVASKTNCIREIISSTFYSSWGIEVLAMLLVHLSFNYLNFKNEIQYILNKFLLEFTGKFLIVNFIDIIFKKINKEKNLRSLKKKKAFYRNKIILNMPEDIRDEIKNLI